MIHKNDAIRIRDDWQDKGDSNLTWIALDDESMGRVIIMPTNTNLPIPPQQTVMTYMVEKVNA